MITATYQTYHNHSGIVMIDQPIPPLLNYLLREKLSHNTGTISLQIGIHRLFFVAISGKQTVQ